MNNNIVTIKKGTHAPLRFPKFVKREDPLRFRVMFTPSCRYTLDNGDQNDVNKLFGIGYYPWHRVNSVRFGWRYDPKVDMIEILCYFRAKGKIKFFPMCFVKCDHWYQMEIYRTEFGLETYKFTIDGGNIPGHGQYYFTKSFLFRPSPRFGYLLRPYFGGNQTAPHDMTIHMERL
jgi:hypothetical protein